MVNKITEKTFETISHIEVSIDLLQGRRRENSSTKDGYKQRPQAKKENKDQGGATVGYPKNTSVMHPWSNEQLLLTWRIPHCVSSVINVNAPRKLLSMMWAQRTVDIS